MNEERDRLRDPGPTGPTADDALTLDPIPERGLPHDDPVDRSGTEGAGTEFGGGLVGGDADFDPDTRGIVGQAGSGTDQVEAPLDADGPRAG